MSHLHLVSDNPTPAPERWEDRPRNTLVTFTLPQETVDGALYGIKNLLWANARMMKALAAVRAGDEETAKKNIDRAFFEMTSANIFADKLYSQVQRSAVRTNPRRNQKRPHKNNSKLD